MTMSSLGREVVAAVSAERATADLAALVRVPSVTGSEEPMAQLVAELAAETGARVERIDVDPIEVTRDPDWPGSEMPRTSLPIVTAGVGRPGGRRLLLVAHTDVVPVGDLATWTVAPWDGLVRAGNLYGRGACDMKGGLASILEALRALVGSGATNRLDGELVAAFVPSEEDGGQGMLAAIRAGCTADLAVVTEPTSLNVVIAHAGAITFRLTVPGRAAAASKRRAGVSALDKLFVLAQALETDEARRNGGETNPLMAALGLPYPTVIGKVEGGEWASMVLDQIVVDGRYGVRLGQSWRDAEADLRDCIAVACAADDFLRDHPATVEITGGRFSSASVPADHPLPVGLGVVASEVLGWAPELRGEAYGADMRLLVNEGRTPTVIFGPGDQQFGHAPDEFVPLDEVADCARVLAAWVVHELVPR
jgi:acetylornithine deacetylase